MVAGMSWVQTALSFSLIAILVCYCRSQVYQSCHIFKGLGCFVVVVLPSILWTKHELTLSFVSV